MTITFGKPDEKIMQELMEQPKVKPLVEKMDAATLQWYKENLVSSGIYAMYALERQKKQLKDAWNKAGK
jgi:hypothetical protein